MAGHRHDGSGPIRLYSDAGQLLRQCQTSLLLGRSQLELAPRQCQTIHSDDRRIVADDIIRIRVTRQILSDLAMHIILMAVQDAA